MNDPTTDDQRLDEIADSHDSHVAEQERKHHERLDVEDQERAEAYDGVVR